MQAYIVENNISIYIYLSTNFIINISDNTKAYMKIKKSVIINNVIETFLAS